MKILIMWWLVIFVIYVNPDIKMLTLLVLQLREVLKIFLNSARIIIFVIDSVKNTHLLN